MHDHAKGGNDTLLASTSGGFDSGNILYGDASTMDGHTHGGNDTLTDSLSGFRSNSTLDGDASSMSGHAKGGNDTLKVTITSFSFATSNSEPDAKLIGDAENMGDYAEGGNDTLTATISGLASAIMSGDGVDVSGHTHCGNDTLTVIAAPFFSFFSAASLFGDSEVMRDSVHGGDDNLNGGSNSDLLFGDAQSYLPSSPGSITGGKDKLDGGGGNDFLWGGPNNDAFKFDLGSGNDTIEDFDQGNLAVGSTAAEHDIINVHDYGFKNWSALRAVIQDDGSGNAVIHLTANDTITLTGVSTAHLHASDFVV
jgi:Ca2+-binding RTX toxin-like protein